MSGAGRGKPTEGGAGRLGALSRRRAVHAAGAFVAMGGWAILANRYHPMPEPVLAGLAQGTASAAITLALKRAIEAIAARTDGATALVLPPLACFLVSLALLVAIHAAAGTPEIATTIAVPLAVSTGYGALYNVLLWRGGNA